METESFHQEEIDKRNYRAIRKSMRNYRMKKQIINNWSDYDLSSDSSELRSGDENRLPAPRQPKMNKPNN